MPFAQYGFEVFKDMIDRQLLTAVQAATTVACERFREGDPYCLEHGVSIGSYARNRPERNPGVDPDALMTEPYIIGNLAGMDVEFRRLLASEAVWELAARLLEVRSDAIVYHCASINRKAPLVGPAVGWHRDFANSYISTIGPWFLRLLIALDSVDQSNAGLGVVSGSHQITDEEARRCESIEDEPVSALYPELEAGDLIAIHSKLQHGGGPNRSHHDRRLLVIQFGRRDASMRHSVSAETETLTLCSLEEMMRAVAV